MLDILILFVSQGQTPSAAGNFSLIEAAIAFVFSWVVLMPIGVIIGGKLLSNLLPLPVATGQFLRIPIPPLLDIRATGQEVVLGFAGFIVTLLAMGVAAGSRAHTFFSAHFGVDPGHFNSLCVLSSFTVVTWALVLFLVVLLVAKLRRKGGVEREHERLITELSKPEGGADARRV
jgi:hypothetical protein